MIVFSFIGRKLVRICLRLMEKGLAKKPLNPNEVDHGKIQRIIIIRQHDGLNDLLLSSPVFRAVRQRYPNAYISVLTRSKLDPVLIHNVYLDDVICFHNRATDWSFEKIVHFLKLLRAKYDLAIVLNTISHSLISDFMAYLTGAKYILGSEHLIFPKCKSNFLYNLIAPYSEFNKHQTERNLDIVRHINIDTEDLSEEMNLTKEELDGAIESLIENGLKPNDMIVAINFSGANNQNCWQVGKYVEVAKYLSATYNASIVMIVDSTRNDLELEFLQGLPFKPVEVVGLNYRELAAVLYFCNILICDDSEIMHLAASVGTAFVAIFTKSDLQQWKPLGQQFMALIGEDGLCSSISEHEVMKLAEKLLKLYPKSLKFDVTEFDISEKVLQDYLNILDTFDE